MNTPTDADVLLFEPKKSGIYSRIPSSVAVVKSVNEIQDFVRNCISDGTSVTANGRSTAFSGSNLGDRIMDVRFMDRIINVGNGIVIAETGATFYNINLMLDPQGKHIPTWPFSYKSATVGGNVATNLTSPRSDKYGFYERYVRSVDFVDGLARYHNLSEQPNAAHTRSMVDDVVYVARRLQADTRAREDLFSRQDELRNVLGYNLYALFESDTNMIISRLMVGSLGSLGIFHRFTLHAIDKIHDQKKMFIIYSDTFKKLFDLTDKIRYLRPMTCDFLDAKSVQLTKAASNDPFILEGNMLLVEFDEEINFSENELARNLQELGLTKVIKVDTIKDQEAFWVTRLRVHSLIKDNSDGIYFNPTGGTTVPVNKLSEFVSGMYKAAEENNVPIFIYGHPSYGDIHMKWILDKNLFTAREQAMAMYKELYKLKVDLGGYITGDPGIFITREQFMLDTWGDRLTAYMHDIKNIFDPHDVLNRDVMFSNKPGFQKNILDNYTTIKNTTFLKNGRLIAIDKKKHQLSTV